MTDKPEYGPFRLEMKVAVKLPDGGSGTEFRVGTVTWEFGPAQIPTPAEIVAAAEKARKGAEEQLGTPVQLLGRHDYYNMLLAERGTTERFAIPGPDKWAAVE